MIDTVNNDELYTLIEKGESFVLLAYTSMCGTCEKAKDMLSIVSLSTKDINFYQINVNLSKEFIESFNISSVPAFLLFKEGKLIDEFYAFQSVTYIYNKVRQIL